MAQRHASGAAPNPLHREAAAVATDTRRQRLVMVGGLEGDDELADVWVADLRSGPARWRQLCSPTSCGAGPQARWGAHAVYDPVADRIVLFGGRRTDGTTYGDVWALSMNGAPVWSRLEVVGDAPAPRWGGAAGYDRDRRMIVAGGQTGPDGARSAMPTPGRSRSTAHPLARLAPAGAAPEPRRSARSHAHDRRLRQLLVTGGLNAATGAHFNDVWALTLGGDRAGWSRLADRRARPRGARLPAVGERGLRCRPRSPGAAVRPRPRSLLRRHMDLHHPRPALARACSGRMNNGRGA